MILKKECLSSSLLFNREVEDTGRAIKQEIAIKGIQTQMKK